MPYWFDGNNLVGQPAAQLRLDRRTKREFLEFLSSLTTGRSGRFTVFFDGDDPDRALPPRGVRVRYSAPLSTDEAMVRGIEETRTPSEFIVVTNDQSLAGRCRSAGARTMDWREFTVRTRRRDRMRKEEKSVDIRDWARFLGLEEESLD